MKPILYTLFLAILTASTTWAQIGINEPEPDKTAVLELKDFGDAKGLLIPRIATGERILIQNPADGLLVFDTDLDEFLFYSGTKKKWRLLSPWTRKGDPEETYTLTNVGIGTDDPSEKLEVNGKIKATNLEVTEKITASEVEVSNTVKATTFKGNGTIPLRGIIMWSGDPDNDMPDGFALCDGNSYNGIQTPDLSGRFIVGYGTGKGDDYKSIGEDKGKGKEKISHEHSIDHNHPNTSVVSEISIPLKGQNNEDAFTKAACAACESTVAKKAHRHNILDIKTPNHEGKSETVTLENRPPYYVLAFIMRIE